MTSKRNAVLSGIGGFLLITVGYTVLHQDIGWMSIWWMWLIPLVIAPLIALAMRSESCSAGADWFAIGKRFVDTYALSSVEVKAPTHYRELELEDSSGRRTSVQLMTVQANRDLWDLVYNGILHSVVHGGADTNALARRALKLPTTSGEH